MAKSALLKSSIAKKYWMAFTGLFLCLFLAGHLAGNLQLIFGTPQQFNEYALFMTSNPAVKLLSYVTYISIIFHAVDGILLTVQNRKARPIGYVKTTPGANSGIASRNMAVLGTVILVFIVTHMVNFWAKMHFDKKMPLYTVSATTMGNTQELYVTKSGTYIAVMQAAKSKAEAQETGSPLYIENAKFFNTQAELQMAEGYKDLYKITVDFFRDAKIGFLATVFYVLAMIALAFHLWHGFQSAFQSLGVNNKFTPLIKLFGRGFAIIVPLLFAIIPLYLHFTK